MGIAKPNFLIAGGVATGTSFLSAAMVQHPDIYLPRIQRPEPNFFHYSYKYERGLDWYLDTWFKEVNGERAVGERSSLLLPSKVAPQRILSSFPNVKLIFCLRNPVERAWANYRFSVLEGLEPLSFEDALDKEDERVASAEGRWAEIQPHSYIGRSRYSPSIAQYLEFFGKDQILLLKSEQLGRNTERSLRSVYEFLGVDTSFSMVPPPNYSSPSVFDNSVQAELRSYFGDRFPEVIESVRRGQDPSSIAKTKGDVPYVAQLQSNLYDGKISMPDKTRLHVRELLSEELKALKELVDFSMVDWE